MAKLQKRGFVYFVRQGQRGPIKIGFAARPERRLIDLQVANPYPLHLLLVVPGTMHMEFSIHAKFIRDHVHGEWFRGSKAVMALIEQWSADPTLAADYLERTPKPRSLAEATRHSAAMAHARGVALANRYRRNTEGSVQ